MAPRAKKGGAKKAGRRSRASPSDAAMMRMHSSSEMAMAPSGGMSTMMRLLLGLVALLLIGGGVALIIRNTQKKNGDKQTSAPTGGGNTGAGGGGSSPTTTSPGTSAPTPATGQTFDFPDVSSQIGDPSKKSQLANIGGKYFACNRAVCNVPLNPMIYEFGANSTLYYSPQGEDMMYPILGNGKGFFITMTGGDAFMIFKDNFRDPPVGYIGMDGRVFINYAGTGHALNNASQAFVAELMNKKPLPDLSLYQ